jgi:hypothetical protein
MSKPTVVIGDIHGRREIVKEALASDRKVVFVGDFLDSYDRSIDDQINGLMDALTAARMHPHKVQLIMGNHERSYLYADEVCSGFNGATYAHVLHLHKLMDGLMRPYVWSDGFLISHAGVSDALLGNLNRDLNEYLREENYTQVGKSRGGLSQCGGLYWCDWFDEFHPIEGTPQVVGHTGYRPEGYREGILSKGNSFNVDCLDHTKEFLEIENGEGRIVCEL